ncbi:MAG: hypothetical protein GXP31_00325 [Kiritimatiellaeota bacterium]|nr:hypothetical protein [Kiritimatiellota bacterium]
MMMNIVLLFPAILAAATASGTRPVETGTYLTGAWFAPRTEAERRLYLEGGFTLVPYSKRNVEWAAANGLRFIGSVSAWGMPPGTNELFEAADGTRSASVGLFTRVNFSSPRVAAWWEKRVPELIRRMPGADRVAFWKVHNEFGYHSGKIFDYSPGSIQRYRSWLKQRYGTVAALNKKWRTSWREFEAVEPPRTREEMRAQLPNWLEWRRFTCWNFADYFRHTGNLIRTVVPGAAVSDNFYPTSPLQGWDDFELARQTDYMAYDIYAVGRWSRLIASLDRARSAAAAWQKPFILMEYHAGPNHWARTVRYRDLIIEAFMALARESRAIQWFRWIPGDGGRERGIHGMMDSRGRPTERFTAAAQTSAFTQRLAPLLLQSRTRAQVAVVTSTDNAFLAYALKEDTWKDRRRWEVLCRLLDAARIQFDQVDPVWIASHDLGRYRAVIVAPLPVLDARVLDRLRQYARNGGTLVMHPDVGVRDGVGLPRQLPSLFAGAARASTDKLWRVRVVRSSQKAVVVERIGAGRIVRCGYELPDSSGPAGVFAARAAMYARLLADHAGVKPALGIENIGPAAELDARRLQAGPSTLVFLTSLGDKPLENVRVLLPDMPADMPVLLFEPESGAVRRLVAEFANGDLRFTVPRIAPAVCVLATRAWQPVLSLGAPREVHPGDVFEARVWLENCGAEAVAARVSLTAPQGWTVTPVAQSDTSLAVQADAWGASRAAVFRVGVGRDTAVDRFAVANSLIARATFTAGRSGVLAVRHTPRVLPPLDVLVRYHDELVTPWQELTPAVMRWGWQNEVRTPPPQPVACGVDVPVVLELAVASELVGRTIRFRLSGPGRATVRPEAVRMDDPRRTVRATVFLEKPGRYTLEAACGTVARRVEFAAGVNTETVVARLTQSRPRLPTGWRLLRLLGVGARDADCAGRPAVFAAAGLCPSPGRAAVFDSAGAAVSATLAADTVRLSADVPRDGVAVYALAQAPGNVPPPRPQRVRISHPDSAGIEVRGDAWAVCFDVDLGLVRWLELAGRRVAPWRTGIVARTPRGEEWAPDGTTGATDFGVSGSCLGAEVSFQRLVGPSSTALTVSETWSVEPARAAVRVRIANRTRRPIRLASLDYELGIEPKTLPDWRLFPSEGETQRGTFPEGFSANAGMIVDWCVKDGATGLALTLGRCALSTKWQSGFAGVRHSVRGTGIGLMRDVRLDPGDVVLAEFELWPHRDRLGAIGTLVTATRL